uniref:Protein argonaute MEL1 n=1 Tax=Aegilops tauschii TaxID=37682 RepID=M8CQD7_AEGTA
MSVSDYRMFMRRSLCEKARPSAKQTLYIFPASSASNLIGRWFFLVSCCHFTGGRGHDGHERQGSGRPGAAAAGLQDAHRGQGGGTDAGVQRGGHRDAGRGHLGAHRGGLGRGGLEVGAVERPVGAGRGRPPATATVPGQAEVEALSGEMERRLAVSEAVQGSSSSAPAAAATGAQESQVAVVVPPRNLPPASSKSTGFHARPGYGTAGKRCRVRANHLLVQVAGKEIYHYDVSISPESMARERNRSIINELVRLHKQHLDGRLPVYDGRKGMFTAAPLPFKTKEFIVKVSNTERGYQGEKEYKVTIKEVAKLNLYNLQQFLAGRQRELPQDTIQALDIALRETPTAKYTPISRSFFSKSFGHGGDIGSGVECWRGYYQSLRPTQMGLSLNIDISATAFYKAQPVMDFALEYLNIRGDAPRRLFDQDRLKLKKALKGVRVVATHRPDISIRYKITGITSAPLNELTFDLDGTRVSVVQYFKRQYDYSLKYVQWPCLQAGSDSRPTYLPMEVCNILGGQRYSRKLNERQVTNILRLACERPDKREGSIVEVINRNNYGIDDNAKEFGIKVMNQLALVDARVLPPPRLKYHQSGREQICNPSVGQWNMNNKRMINGGSIRHWACVSFGSRLQWNDVSVFCNYLVGTCNNMGMQARQGNLEAVKNIYRQSAQVLAQQGLEGQNLELLFVVLPDGPNASDCYGRVKRLCEIELGLITQCCLPKHVQRAGTQYLQNMALKINVKVGGRNTVLENALLRRIPLLTDKPTIIFGADVTHPSPGEDVSPSIAAVVASMDWPEVSKYTCLVSSQGHREEIIADLFTEVKDPQKGVIYGGMIRELLLSFYKANKSCKPGRIIFYRDGVSEGQFSQVLLYEMDAIYRACSSLENGYLPQVTFVVVQKRHHTRLFPEDHRSGAMADRSGNILPGTVVDTKICHPSEFDFYLCSHAGIQLRTVHAVRLDCSSSILCALGGFPGAAYLDDNHSDQGSSSVGGTRRFDQAVPVKPLPKVKESVRQFMFYC